MTIGLCRQKYNTTVDPSSSFTPEQQDIPFGYPPGSTVTGWYLSVVFI